MFCQKCGKEIPDDLKNCPSCGAKIKSADKKKKVV